ncbi:MAG: aminotransferase class V-fold PLP-dependent enzyme [Planctomycetes bacterium]|mgnify:FL=1|jgi:cysteine desulfurase|nr:aminotransferase class V-fold PLP-dependent enzyme [Planctomycetota bacterium]MBT4559829.1 aminotransferase class V-fold PLP-dependent enzyme [Planctomycetota bacterium]MBT5102393.1 aminotransferase class V-fold PLP-dependent enzyme [Planctomycetota bacterium]MBT7011760.1 aminotransferase class V-fold PLP-dependent enzyme [Planctomycetota bacterium]MBT7318335.1 aminotransferase class V-fold PLP-dependent enzyme [Planctomycetota bacterium]
MESLYLDHAATAPVLPDALSAFESAAREHFANPGSLHQAGADAARLLEKSRASLQKSMGAERYQIVFVGTGTEANFLGIQGLARSAAQAAAGNGSAKPNRILYGAAEHPAAREAACRLRAEGFQVESIPVDSQGLISADSLAQQLSNDVALVTIQWANNEIGGLNPLADLVRTVRQLAPQAIFHTDAVQAAGKRPEWFDQLGADAISTAAHKIGGVRGCAALFLHQDLAHSPIPFFAGGGHENGLRAGTENVAGAVAFAEAARIRRERLSEDPSRYHARREQLIHGILGAWPNAVVLGPTNSNQIQGSILSVALPGARAETLLHQLETYGILVGSGSACSSKGHTTSPVLTAMALPTELHNCVLRFSIDGTELEPELQRVRAALAEIRALHP